ncbi:MAG: hypothetical protein U0470_05810 [Anaerolineae bacterium]
MAAVNPNPESVWQPEQMLIFSLTAATSTTFWFGSRVGCTATSAVSVGATRAMARVVAVPSGCG